MALSRIGLCHIVTEGQVQHLVHVAQLPVVGLLTGQTGAVDAALLAGTHADGLTIIGVAHAVGLGVLQGDEGNNESRFCSSVTSLFSVTQLFSMVSALMTSSLRPCSKVMPYTCLCSMGAGL